MPPNIEAVVRLRLYIARSTPNSVRAERNLMAVLGGLKAGCTLPTLEVIDVFSQPKRAILDGIIVTPTLLCLFKKSRITLIGDLADLNHLECVIQNLAY